MCVYIHQMVNPFRIKTMKLYSEHINLESLLKSKIIAASPEIKIKNMSV